jgi:hypothetical protein
MTAKRIISGEVLKYRNGLGISGDYETRSVSASHFALTMPSDNLHFLWEAYSNPEACILSSITEKAPTVAVAVASEVW